MTRSQNTVVQSMILKDFISVACAVAKNPSYLLCNQTLIENLLSFIPFLLQLLAQGWVHLQKKQKSMQLIIKYHYRYYPAAFLPRRECGWQTSGVSKVIEYRQVLGSDT